MKSKNKRRFISWRYLLVKIYLQRLSAYLCLDDSWKDDSQNQWRRGLMRDGSEGKNP